MALIAAAALAAACSSTPPPEPVVPDPITEPERPPKPPKPPPPCKALDEECKAKSTTRAKITGGDLAFKPAKGWMYAQAETGTVAQESEEGSAIVIIEVDITDAKQEPAQRDAALAAIAKAANLTLPKKKANWKRPDDTKEIAGMKVGLWQIDGASRGEKKGPLLIFAAPREEGKKAMVGFGFVPSDDSSGADDAILESIESIAPVAEE